MLSVAHAVASAVHKSVRRGLAEASVAVPVVGRWTQLDPKGGMDQYVH